MNAGAPEMVGAQDPRAMSIGDRSPLSGCDESIPSSPDQDEDEDAPWRPPTPSLNIGSLESEGGMAAGIPSSWGLDPEELEKLAVQMAVGASEAPVQPPEFPVVVPLSTDSSGDCSPCGMLRACKGCQKAKTACSPEQRPCARCTRLKMDCDSDQPPVKTACTNCRRAKVKCLFEKGENCIRCSRLGIECAPHVPGKRKRLGPAERAANGGRSPGSGKSRAARSAGRELLDGTAASLQPFLQALPMLAQQCEEREARAALEALRNRSAAQLTSPAAESLFGGESSMSDLTGSSPGALSAVMTLMMVRDGLPWQQMQVASGAPRAAQPVAAPAGMAE